MCDTEELGKGAEVRYSNKLLKTWSLYMVRDSCPCWGGCLFSGKDLVSTTSGKQVGGIVWGGTVFPICQWGKFFNFPYKTSEKKLLGATKPMLDNLAVN